MDEVIPVSAKYGHGVDDVKEWILSKLPLGPSYYPKVFNKSCFCSLIFFLLSGKMCFSKSIVLCHILSSMSSVPII